MQVPLRPQVEPEGLGQGHTAPFPRGPRVHSPPRAQGQACSPLHRTQAALPTPTGLRLERSWDHRNHLALMVRGRKFRKENSAHDNRFPSSHGPRADELLSPSPQCSAFCTRPVGRVCQAQEQEQLGAGLQVGRLPQAHQFYVNTRQRPSFSPQDQPWDSGITLPEAFCFCRTDPARLLCSVSY